MGIGIVCRSNVKSEHILPLVDFIFEDFFDKLAYRESQYPVSDAAPSVLIIADYLEFCQIYRSPLFLSHFQINATVFTISFPVRLILNL